MSFIPAGEVPAIRQAFRDLEDTIKVTFWDVAWSAWSLDRPENGPTQSWSKGTADETWYLVATGDGKLRGGKGGPAIGGQLIYQQDPYELRHEVAANLRQRMKIVVGNRLFRVDSVADRAGERQHATAYLTEIFGEELPGVTA